MKGLIPILVKQAEKRGALCDLIYSFISKYDIAEDTEYEYEIVQQQVCSQLRCLRAVKDGIGRYVEFDDVMFKCGVGGVTGVTSGVQGNSLNNPLLDNMQDNQDLVNPSPPPIPTTITRANGISATVDQGGDNVDAISPGNAGVIGSGPSCAVTSLIPSTRGRNNNFAVPIHNPNALGGLHDSQTQSGVKFVAAYIACLAHFIYWDIYICNITQQSMSEHLQDLYVYYALMGIQSSRASVRVDGLAILNGLIRYADYSNEKLIHVNAELCRSALNILSSVLSLAQDPHWEVQAQLLVFASNLLLHIAGIKSVNATLATTESSGSPNNNTGDNVEGAGSGTSIIKQLVSVVENPQVEETIYLIIKHCFHHKQAKNTLQIALCHFARNLDSFPQLIPAFLSILLQQPPGLRARLLHATSSNSEESVTFVIGRAAKSYTESSIGKLWPPLKMAHIFVNYVKNEYQQELGIASGCQHPNMPPSSSDNTSPHVNDTPKVSSHLGSLLGQLEVCPPQMSHENGVLDSKSDSKSLAHFEKTHFDVLHSILASSQKGLFESGNSTFDEFWMNIFNALKQYIFVGLLDTALHYTALHVLRSFWLGGVGSDGSGKLLQMLIYEASREQFCSMYTLLQSTQQHHPRMIPCEQMENALSELIDAASPEVKIQILRVIKHFNDRNPSKKIPIG